MFDHCLKVDKLMNDEVKNIAGLMFGHSNYFPDIQSGCCLKCGYASDLKSLHATVDEADLIFQRYKCITLRSEREVMPCSKSY